MLPYRSHWHFAFEQDPTREARLLGFASGPHAPQGPDPEPTPDSANTPASPNPVAAESVKTAQDVKDVLDEEKKIAKGKTAPDETAALIDEKTKKKEAIQAKFQKVIDAARQQAVEMHQIRIRMEDGDLQQFIVDSGDEEALRNWKKDMQLLESEEINTSQEKLFAEALQAFWEGEMAPEVFLCERGDYLQQLPYGFGEIGSSIHGVLNAVDASESNKMNAQNQWATRNQSDRIQIIDEVLKNVQMGDWLTNKERQYGEMQKKWDKYKSWLEQVEESKLKNILRENIEPSGGLLDELRKIRFYSINDFLSAGQKYWSALKSTLEQRGERYSADIARQFGMSMERFNFWPIYGDEVATILDQQLDAKSNEETESIKKQLEGDHAKWEDLFSPQGVFYQFMGKNPNKTRGVLEYAAEHGFLYDIDEDITDHSHPIYGKKLADICFDWKSTGDYGKISNYFTSLRGKNSSGREHEMDHGYKMDYDNENVPRFIELVEHEMDEHNLWAAAGVCKRAIERGLRGEVSAWLFTTIMNKLRKYPELRKVTPVYFFDIIGKLSMYNTAFTLGWAKGYRNELRLWAATGDEAALEKTELKHLSTIEREIIEKDSTTDYTTPAGKMKLNQTVAQVLGGQIVELPGGYMHIFETKYRAYRDAAKMMFAAVADPLKEDSDYAREDTEKTMLPEVVFKKILKYTSTFEFTDEAWVQAFLGSLISMAHRLKEIPELRDAYENYCTEIREKMDLHYNSFRKDANRSIKQLSTMDPKTGKPALASLVAENLLSVDVMGDTEFTQELKNQLYTYFGIGTGVTAPKKKTNKPKEE